ncbi:MAG: replicative DNA helicase [Bacteroidales bacterium]|nr:replicative DNA helicase [Bacteroidales bacterium]
MQKEYKSRKKNEPDAIASASAEIGNKPPQAPEIEEAVIGAMMIEDDCVYKATEVLTEKSFYDPKHRLIFAAIMKLFKKRSPIDLMTVSERLREDGVLEEVGGPSKLAAMTSGIGSAANIEYYIRILQQKTIQRDLITAGYEMLKKAFDETYDVDKLIQESQDGVYRAVQGNMRSAYVPFAESLNRALERIQRSQQSTGLTGIPSGFPSLDTITMGWQDGNLIVIGARPGHGKTAIALNMARCAAIEHNIPAALFSLEMTDVELADRLIATETGLPSDKRKGRVKMKDEEWTQLESGLTRAAKAPLFIDETPGLTISEFTSKIKRMHLEQKIRIAFVDYIQLMHGNPAMAQYRALEIGEISRQLKETAKELRIPIITLAQLNRNLTARQGTMNGRPMLSDLKDSGSIEQDADIVLFINQPAKLGFTEGPDNLAELIIAKNRAGETGVINLTFNGDIVKFTESSESLYEYAERTSQSAPQQQRPSAWDQVSGVVGSYDPFSSFENRYPAEF